MNCSVCKSGAGVKEEVVMAHGSESTNCGLSVSFGLLIMSSWNTSTSAATLCQRVKDIISCPPSHAAYKDEPKHKWEMRVCGPRTSVWLIVCQQHVSVRLKSMLGLKDSLYQWGVLLMWLPCLCDRVLVCTWCGCSDTSSALLPSL